ncbi:hypothetical protein J1N35_002600 [Gossypium stocksii]|uniref:Uncharacterized protein n=1 Tax=Gossypium stocksii TaxID=47602 RepID=A0A9D4AMW0_9ROSI|nr:hypothetical protein J1N35_002600 [Gossypium stocksii]
MRHFVCHRFASDSFDEALVSICFSSVDETLGTHPPMEEADKDSLYWQECKMETSQWPRLVDGAVSSLKNIAAASRLLRDHNDAWMAAFARCIGTCSVVQAELWGRNIKDFLVRQRKIQIRHVYNEINRVADCLSKKDLFDDLGIKFLDNPPKELEEILSTDGVGITFNMTCLCIN